MRCWLLQACSGGGTGFALCCSFHDHITYAGPADSRLSGATTNSPRIGVAATTKMRRSSWSMEDGARDAADDDDNAALLLLRRQIDDLAFTVGMAAAEQNGHHAGPTSSSSLKARLYRALKACAAHKHLALGRRVQELAVAGGFRGDAFLATHLIVLYAACGSLDDARRAFESVPAPDKHNWAAAVAACARLGDPAGALALYMRVRDEGRVAPDARVLVAAAQAAGALGDLAAARAVHADAVTAVDAAAVEGVVVVSNAVVHMYVRCGSLDEARAAFDAVPADRRVPATWNTMIGGYARRGRGEDALRLYERMAADGTCRPGKVTWVCALQACAGVGPAALRVGVGVHGAIAGTEWRADAVLGGSLVNMYAKCGDVARAREVFQGLQVKTAVTWTALMAGYVRAGAGEAALRAYADMQAAGAAPTAVTLACAAQACACLGGGGGGLRQGRRVHRQAAAAAGGAALEDPVVAGSLVDMYAKCGDVDAARAVFDGVPRRRRDVAAWNAMIAGYARAGRAEDALRLYTRMLQDEGGGGDGGGVAPDAVTALALVQACAAAASLPLARRLHAHIRDRGLLHHHHGVGAALVHLYAQCGSMPDARAVFDGLPPGLRAVEAWGALAAGYARHGDHAAALSLLRAMTSRDDGEDGVQNWDRPPAPNEVVFLCALAACAHAGRVDAGQAVFRAMLADHPHLEPGVAHYACLVDMLARGGRVEEALRVARGMPVPPDQGVWTALLAACRKWTDLDGGGGGGTVATGMVEEKERPSRAAAAPPAASAAAVDCARQAGMLERQMSHACM